MNGRLKKLQNEALKLRTETNFFASMKDRIGSPDPYQHNLGSSDNNMESGFQ